MFFTRQFCTAACSLLLFIILFVGVGSHDLEKASDAGDGVAPTPTVELPSSAYFKLSTLWARRVAESESITSWYNSIVSLTAGLATPTDPADNTLAPDQPLTPADVRLARLITPFHALHLFLSARVFNFLELALPLPSVHFTLCVLVAVGLPLMWVVCLTPLARIVVEVRLGKQTIARAKKDGGDETTKGESDAHHDKREKQRIRKVKQEEEEEVQRVTAIGFVVLVLVVLIPSLLVEITTLYPVCLASLLTLLGLAAITREHHTRLHCPRPEKKDFLFDSPVGTLGNLHFITFTTQPLWTPLRFSVLGWWAIVAAAMLIPSYGFLMAPLAVWSFMVAFHAGVRRLGVFEVKSSSATLIGFSSVKNRVLSFQLLGVLAIAVLAVVVVLLSAMNPLDGKWMTGEGAAELLTQFIGPRRLPASSTVTTSKGCTIHTSNITVIHSGGSNSFHNTSSSCSPFVPAFSFTGASEAKDPRCLEQLPDEGWCTVFMPNLWQAAERFGVPLSSALMTAARRLSADSSNNQTATSNSSGLLLVTEKTARMPHTMLQMLALTLFAAGAVPLIALLLIQPSPALWFTEASKPSSPTASPASSPKPEPSHQEEAMPREDYLCHQYLLMLRSVIAGLGLIILTAVKPDATLLLAALPPSGMLLAFYAMLNLSRAPGADSASCSVPLEGHQATDVLWAIYCVLAVLLSLHPVLFGGNVWVTVVMAVLIGLLTVGLAAAWWLCRQKQPRGQKSLATLMLYWPLRVLVVYIFATWWRQPTMSRLQDVLYGLGEMGMHAFAASAFPIDSSTTTERKEGVNPLSYSVGSAIALWLWLGIVLQFIYQIGAVCGGSALGRRPPVKRAQSS